ncbi:MAG TPA: hypothetical protein VMF89_12415, partial [Polyangiales bacterium]|nr:hypothetical protein [Polyangiales bacterium]
HQTRVFELQQPGAYQSYRLRVTANHGDPKLQLAELELLRVRSDRTPPPAAAPSPRSDSLWCKLMKRCSCGVVAPGSAGGFPWVLLAVLSVFSVVTVRRRKCH